MIPERRSRKAAQPLKAVLLDKAFILLDQGGPDSVTIRAVARAAGVSHAAPANHFVDRKQLLTELAGAVFRQFLDRVQGQPADNRARAYLAELADFALAFPGRYELLWRRDLVDWENPAFLAPLNAAYADFLAALGASSSPAKGRQQDLETLATAAWSMVHGYAVLRSTGVFEPRHDSRTGKPRMDAMLDLLLGQDGAD